jgi:hypothetical protein
MAAGTVSVGVSAYQERQQQRPPIPAIEKIRDNLYVIKGSDPNNRSTMTGGNTAVFITEQGVVVVDTKIRGYGRGILDQIVTKLMLEVNNPANCARVLNDPLNVSGYAGYSSTFCAADNPRSAKLLACGYYEAGLRVFDIRDPSRPREIAYYKPPARGKDFLPGSGFGRINAERTADAVVLPYFRPERHEIWFISHDNGFQIVRFTDWIRAT